MIYCIYEYQRGKDYAIPVASQFRWRMLFGAFLFLFQMTFLNLSVVSIALVGVLLSWSASSLVVLALAVVAMGLSTAISWQLSDYRTLLALSHHFRAVPTSRIEFVSNAMLENEYGIKVLSDLVTSPSELQFRIFPSERPTKEAQDRNQGDGFKGRVRGQLLGILSRGYRLILRPVEGSLAHRSSSFDAFVSRNYKVVIAPSRSAHEPTPARKWMIAHEIGHMNLLSAENYFGAESMIRCILPLPIALAFITITPASALLCLAICVFYIFLRYQYYPSRLPLARLRDEVNADRYATMSVSSDVVGHIVSRVVLLQRLVADSAPSDSDAAFSPSERSQADIGEYRIELLREEARRRLESDRPRGFWGLLDPRDHNGCLIASNAHPLEGIIGIGIAALAVMYYEVGDHTILTGSVGIGVLAITLSGLCFASFCVFRQVRSELMLRYTPQSEHVHSG